LKFKCLPTTSQVSKCELGNLGLEVEVVLERRAGVRENGFNWPPDPL
jgi:hypothetical protein